MPLRWARKRGSPMGPQTILGKSAKLLKRFGVPDGIRTRVTAVKGRCPRPLDDGDATRTRLYHSTL